MTFALFCVAGDMRISLFLRSIFDHMPRRSCPSSHRRLVSAWDHATAWKSSWCRPRLRVLACCQAVSALLLESSNLHTNCKQAVHALLHNLSLCTLVQSIRTATDGSIIHFVHHFPSCPSFMSIIFPILPAQPSLSVGNNRDSDATINLLRREAPDQTGCKARSIATRLSAPQHESPDKTGNHLGYFPFAPARADQGGVHMHLLLSCFACPHLSACQKNVSDIGCF
jgi:hypothetical protein